MKFLVIVALATVATVQVEAINADKSSSDLYQKYFEQKNKVSFATEDTMEDMLQKLNGRIIYIEADTPYRGHYMNAAYGKIMLDYVWYVPITIQAVDQIIEDVSYKWNVTYLGESHIALENMNARNYYLSSETQKEFIFSKRQFLEITVLKESGYPKGDESVKLLVNGGGVNTENHKLSFLNLLFNVIPLGDSAIRVVGPSSTETIWRTYVPETTDEYAYLDTVDNSQHNRDVEWSYTTTVGISKTNGQTITNTLEISLGYELSSAFGKFSVGLKYSHAWQKQTSQTFSKSVSKTLKTTVAAGAKLEVMQLIGHYGSSFKVQADDFKFIDLKTKKVYKSIDDFNQEHHALKYSENTN